MPGTVAIFVDGDNLPGHHADDIMDLGKSLGTLILARAYGGELALQHWADRPTFQFVFSGTGKNAADLHLAIDAMDYTTQHNADTVLLCSSDGDFFHLARRLREKGLDVIGYGEQSKITERFMGACTEVRFARRPAPQPCAKANGQTAQTLDHKIRDVIKANSSNGQGVAIVDLAATMYKKFGVKISQQPERTWRAYLGKRTTKYDLDPRGPNAKVRFLPSGF